ncbi:hypothetical protein FRACYDRAFT_252768 [Fragilariopsis cylindrus CCMP1102]|uniref:Uncharacterized protein n=1 Tax=Fragilariopsis cylindrus CCMP1102 TaxID=635003 RepID=A0A1E7ELS1_9STRA|nr:hypothetical protein FRACYDRAFT_252768 [Fragilariopsis cylindrus CCMP1102]|eukprot:OEU06868.1 hypothetical protein FRACYDRAFT_252768 [Fragilariopsis cylindrus CCMP1102]
MDYLIQIMRATTIVEVTAKEVAEAEVAIKHVLSLNADIIYYLFGIALDQYVSILSTNNVNGSGIATLKSIVYEETNVSNWRQSNLKAFVKLAPNLESLILRENMYWKWNNDGRFLQQDSLQELLPLRNSLQKLVLFNRLNIVIDNNNTNNENNIVTIQPIPVFLLLF